jgi:hypothetical protein
MRVLFAFFLAAVLIGEPFAQQPGPANMAGTPSPADKAKIAEVILFEKEMEAAVLRGNAKFLERALADDYRFTHGDAWTTGGPPLRLDNKQTWIAYATQKPSPYISRELDSVQVELHGDIAITCGRYKAVPRPNANNPISGPYSIWFERVYAKRNGRWQQLSHRTVRGPIREEDNPKASS